MRTRLTSPPPPLRLMAGGLALAALVGGILLLPAPAQAAEAGCPASGGAWIREERTAEQAVSATVAAPSLMLIVETCVSTGDAVAYETYSPGQKSVTLASPLTGDGSQPPIAHVSYRVEMAPQVPGACLPEPTPCPTDPSTPAPTPSTPTETAPPVPAPAATAPPAASGAPADQTGTAHRRTPATVLPAVSDLEPDAGTPASDAGTPGLATVPRTTADRTAAEPTAHLSDAAGAATVVSAVSRVAAPLDAAASDDGPAGLRVLLGALLLGTGATATVVLRRRGTAA